MNEERKADVRRLTGVANLLEALPYTEEAIPAVRRAIESLEMEIQMDEDFSSEDLDLNSPLVNASFDRFKIMTGKWECKDYADGWIAFPNLSEAIDYQATSGCIMRPAK